MTDRGSLVGPTGSSYGQAINDVGQVAGISDAPAPAYIRAFVWDATTGMQDIGSLVEGGFSEAYGINAAGQVVGWSASSAGGYHAFVWDRAGGMQDLGSLMGPDGHSVAYAINSSGHVVGVSQTSPGGPDHAFVWDSSTGMHDLGTLTGNSATSLALAINSAGQIVGYWPMPDGTFNLDRATMMTPIPPDMSAPVTTAAFAGPVGASGWYTGAVQVTLTATDDDGPADVAATLYTLDGGAPQPYTAPLTLSG